MISKEKLKIYIISNLILGLILFFPLFCGWINQIFNSLCCFILIPLFFLGFNFLIFQFIDDLCNFFDTQVSISNIKSHIFVLANLVLGIVLSWVFSIWLFLSDQDKFWYIFIFIAFNYLVTYYIDKPFIKRFSISLTRAHIYVITNLCLSGLLYLQLFVIPIFKGLYDNASAELPLFTVSIIFLARYWYILTPLMVAGVNWWLKKNIDKVESFINKYILLFDIEFHVYEIVNLYLLFLLVLPTILFSMCQSPNCILFTLAMFVCANWLVRYLMKLLCHIFEKIIFFLYESVFFVGFFTVMVSLIIIFQFILPPLHDIGPPIK